MADELRQRQPRIRDEAHLNFIRSQPCCICGTSPVEAAHLRVGSIGNGKLPSGMAEKPSDKWTLPLCPRHHREQHSMNEREFWARHGKDPFALAMHYHEWKR
jgi:hypothetical protein